MQLSPSQLIDALGGTFAVARFLGIRPPSVSGWRKSQFIPDDKLARLAPWAEACGVTTRQALLPDTWRQIWPELAAQEVADVKEGAHA